MKYASALFFFIFVNSAVVYAQDIPKNAWIGGSSWYCNDGYRKLGNECIKFLVPEHAWVSGSSWYCNDGYRKQGEECIKLSVPQNAWVSGSSWYCNDGYRKQGEECIKLNVPQKAWVSGGNWYCNDGYRKQGNECVKFEIPNNAFAQGSNWFCNEGYKKQGDSCIRMSQDELIQLRKQQEEQQALLSDGTIAFQTKVDDESGDILKLDNGAIVEISSYFGYLGSRKNAVLYGKGARCNIWIAGKKSYRCELLKSPENRGKPAKEVYISEVRGSGTVLLMQDGSVYEVDSMHTMYTSLWLGMSAGLLIQGTTLINFNSNEAITVHRIK